MNHDFYRSEWRRPGCEINLNYYYCFVISFEDGNISEKLRSENAGQAMKDGREMYERKESIKGYNGSEQQKKDLNAIDERMRNDQNF